MKQATQPLPKPNGFGSKVSKGGGSGNPTQPRNYDAVKGGQNPAPFGGVVLGGFSGVKRRLASADTEYKIAALKEALKYGQEGLELVIQGLKDSQESVQRAAYKLLPEKGNHPHGVECAVKHSQGINDVVGKLTGRFDPSPV